MYEIPFSAISSIPRDNETQFTIVNVPLSMAIDKSAQETVSSLEEVGSSIVGDGEQSKVHLRYLQFGWTWTSEPLSFGGVVIPFADGHSRNLPRLSAGPFKYANYAGSFVTRTKKYANHPVSP